MTAAIREKARAGSVPMPQLVRMWGEIQPDALAFREKDFGIWKRITWGEYARTVEHLALGLGELGFRAGERLAIAGEGIPEWMYADMATQSLGGICVGLYPTSPWAELAYILEHSGTRIAVCGDQEQVDKVLEARKERNLAELKWIIYVDDKGMGGYREDGLISIADVIEMGQRRAESTPASLADYRVQAAARSADDPAIIVYTSGTTGAPKGAMLSHRNMLVAGCSVVDTFDYNGHNLEVLCYLPLCHVAERSFSTVMQLSCGSVVNFAESVDTVSADLREIGPTLFLGVPRIWEKLQQTITIKIKESYSFHRWAYEAALALAMPIARRELAAGGYRLGFRDKLVGKLLHLLMFRNIQRFSGLHRADVCFCGAASVSPETLLFFRAIGLPIYQVYGMTETAAVALVQQPDHTTFGCVGVPIPSLQYRLGDDGELMMKGPTVFLGYLDAKKATDAVLKDGWLASGDIARVVDGEVQIIDRKKDLIITSGGKNISPSEVEHALKESIYIREAIVVGDGRNFVSALIQFDYDTVGKWAQEKALSFTTYRSLSLLPDVRELIDREVKVANSRFARVSQVRKFSLLTKELDHDDGELTATMKVRRKAIEQKFVSEIAEIYGASA